VYARSAGLVAALLAVTIARTGIADDVREVGVFVAAPPASGCLAAERLRVAVQERVGAVWVTDSPDADTRIDVRIVRRSRAFSATIRASDEAGRVLGERSLASESLDCSELERPLLLVVSTLIGIAQEDQGATPSARKEPERSHREQPPKEDPAVDAGPAVVRATADASAPAVPFRFGLALTGGAQTSLLPGVAPLGELRFLARRGWLELRMGVGAAPFGERDLGGAAQARFGALFGDVDACGSTPLTSGSELAFCTGIRGGALRGQSTGLYDNADTVRPFAQLTLRASLQAALSRQHALAFELGGAIPVLPQTYTFVEADGEVHRIHTVELGVFVEAGWVWRFSS